VVEAAAECQELMLCRSSGQPQRAADLNGDRQRSGILWTYSNAQISNEECGRSGEAGIPCPPKSIRNLLTRSKFGVNNKRKAKSLLVLIYQGGFVCCETH
jgi:hypothetical protein